MNEMASTIPDGPVHQAKRSLTTSISEIESTLNNINESKSLLDKEIGVLNGTDDSSYYTTQLEEAILSVKDRVVAAKESLEDYKMHMEQARKTASGITKTYKVEGEISKRIRGDARPAFHLALANLYDSEFHKKKSISQKDCEKFLNRIRQTFYLINESKNEEFHILFPRDNSGTDRNGFESWIVNIKDRNGNFIINDSDTRTRYCSELISKKKFSDKDMNDVTNMMHLFETNHNLFKEWDIDIYGAIFDSETQNIFNEFISRYPDTKAMKKEDVKKDEYVKDKHVWIDHELKKWTKFFDSQSNSNLDSNWKSVKDSYNFKHNSILGGYMNKTTKIVITIVLIVVLIFVIVLMTKDEKPLPVLITSNTNVGTE